MNNFLENRSGGALLHQYLKESPSNIHKGKLDSTQRKKINAELRRKGLDGNARFRSMGQALSAIGGVFNGYDVEIDEPVTADRFRQDTGSASFHIAQSNLEQPMAPVRIPNSMLALQWTKMQSGFEVLAYLS